MSQELPVGPVTGRADSPAAVCFDHVDIADVGELLQQLFALDGMRHVEHLPDMLTQRRQLSMFLRYLARRVAFLNEVPGLIFNETRVHLGSILVERMIKEARDLCRVDLRSDFASTPHQVGGVKAVERVPWAWLVLLARPRVAHDIPSGSSVFVCGTLQFLLMMQLTFILLANQDGVVESANRAGCWRGKLVPLRGANTDWDASLQFRRELPVVNPPVAELVAEGAHKLRE